MPREIVPINGEFKPLHVRVNRKVWRKIMAHLKKQSAERGYRYRVAHFVNDLINDFFSK